MYLLFTKDYEGDLQLADYTPLSTLEEVRNRVKEMFDDGECDIDLENEFVYVLDLSKVPCAKMRPETKIATTFEPAVKAMFDQDDPAAPCDTEQKDAQDSHAKNVGAMASRSDNTW
jgi:hypothetical protein